MTTTGSPWQTVKDHPLRTIAGVAAASAAATYAVMQAVLVAPLKDRVEQHTKDSTAVERDYPALTRSYAQVRVDADSFRSWNQQRAVRIAQQDSAIRLWQVYAQQLNGRLGVASRDASFLAEIRRLEVQKISVSVSQPE